MEWMDGEAESEWEKKERMEMKKLRPDKLWSRVPNEDVGWDGKQETWEKEDGDHSVTVYSQDEFGYRAYVKWDGCIDFEMFTNGSQPSEHDEDNREYIHICNVDDLIRRLEGLRAVGREKFGESWPR